MPDNTPTTSAISPDLEAYMAVPGNTVAVPDELLFDPNLTDGAYRLWIVMSRYKDESDCVSITLRELAKLLRTSHSTARRSLINLEQHGYMRVTRKGTAKGSYQLLIHGQRVNWPQR